MERRDFIIKSTGLAVTAWMAPKLGYTFPVQPGKMDRIGMSTVTFRNRFKQTKPKDINVIENELFLLDIPEYYKSRFNVTNLEFWAPHFESINRDYLDALKDKVRAAGSKLINIQADINYNLANTIEEERVESIKVVKQWVDAAAYLGSKCIRVNPGASNGSIESCIKSMKEINEYAKKKKIILLTENHFGIEMNPDVHLRIIREAGPKNIYTLPDFGNYPRDSMYESLEKIIPYAYLISAKADAFDENMDHVAYDFDRCVQMCERLGFKGIYSVEQWGGKAHTLDFEKVTDWMIDHVKNNI